ncbi:family 20 glycosylhydrolase [Paludibacterium paludis]|uniref:beta-N-acetylhexosaminidase n=1 Tax=Paludibacterium paludis TaxID=1225769 RepID=A0A918UAL3_9NEIS|nr:family 20 glycosylhydrolase [Paludibacterium paludis]GGY17539.1 chitobiase [Paludibacterium paludis]
MKRTTLNIALLTLGWLSLGTAEATVNAKDLAANLAFRIGITDNQAGSHGTDCASLGADWATCYKAEFTLSNVGKTPVAGDGWSLYLHSIRRLLKIDHPGFTLRHLTGDLYELKPAPGFAGLAPGERLALPVIGEYWHILESDALPRQYVVVPGQKPEVLRRSDSENPKDVIAPITGDNWKRSAGDHNRLATPASRFDLLADRGDARPASAVAHRFIPAPLRQDVAEGSRDIKSLALDLPGLAPENIAALKARIGVLGLAADKHPQVVTGRIAKDLPADIAVTGGYRLTIDARGIRIDGYDAEGVFHGVQSLLALLPLNGGKVAHMKVEDAPRYPYRGYMVDVARNNHSPAVLRRMLDQMAAYKLNRLHLHLSNDEGWRLEIPGLPELTRVGARRCHDLTETRCLLPQLASGPDNRSGGGVLTRKDYIDLVRYAAARHILVIPEVDMPAHARAAVVSMEARYQRLAKAGHLRAANEYRLLDPADTTRALSVQFYDRRSFINPCMPGARRFAEKVIREIAAMHKEAGQPLEVWNFGGDEAKNILLGGGYQDLNGTDPGKGRIDKAAQDRPWARSPVCQSLIAQGKLKSVDELPLIYAQTVSELARQAGASGFAAWQDGLKLASGPKAFATPSVLVNYWDPLFWGGDKEAYHWAGKGYQVVLALPDYLYFDFPQEANPREPGYYWGARDTSTYKVFSLAPGNLPQNAEIMPDRDGNAFESLSSEEPAPFAGMEGLAWSEVMRTDQRLEYMSYPRMLALAERAWHRPSWELDYQKGRRFKLGETNWVDRAALNRDWQDFAAVAGWRELPKLEKAGVRPRLSQPGVKSTAAGWEARTELPGIAVQFSRDGGKTWETFGQSAQPGPGETPLWRTQSPLGTVKGREETLDGMAP